ncbi:MAG: hypothetical protein KDK33_19245 [Leptospiraceae bacterium]|nr:hypothetical protein [Leptospiraceae bacterium]
MYKAENRFKQPLLEGIERFPRFSESFSPSELIDDLQTWHTEMVQSSGATSLFGFRSEYAFFVGGAYGAGIAIHYGGRKYDGTFMSNFDMYDYSIYAYSADTRGFKGEVSLEAAQLQGVRDRHELEDALTHSVSIPTRTIIGVTPYYREPIKPDDPGNQSNWFHSQSNRVGWGLSVGAALGASYQSYSFDWTWEDTTAFDKKWPVFILGPVALGMYMASMTENETGVW